MRSVEQILAVFVIITCKMVQQTTAAEGMGITYPGTKWCGPGSAAKHFDDLGKNIEEDKCCRAHDHCEDHLLSGQESAARGLKNTSPFTRLTCKCDKELKDCLKKVNTKLSNSIGNIYFSFQKTCYKLEYPVVSCTKEENDNHPRARRHLHEFFNSVFQKLTYKVDLLTAHLKSKFSSNSKSKSRPCVDYTVDKTAPKKWQFLDLPLYNDDEPHQVFQFDDEPVSTPTVLSNNKN
ncbi:phospholipase A2-like isoform X1 [Culicoides brevitarsis]|uniref:phospholipase A2-like isoform X1 n=1 Tax=Culicoides brevitarsis TaxID=469753 RepID=UPI00307BB7F7